MTFADTKSRDPLFIEKAGKLLVDLGSKVHIDYRDHEKEA